MANLLDKFRLAFASDEAKPRVLRDTQEHARTRACVNCDKVFATDAHRHHCRVCERTVCGACASRYIPPSPAVPGAPWLRVCDFCYHLREPLLAETAAAAHEQLAAQNQSYWLQCTPHAGRVTIDRTGSLTRQGKAALKQVPGDLTWDVPPQLEPAFGLSQADRESAAAAHAAALPPLPPEPPTAIPTSPRHSNMPLSVPEPPFSMQGVLRAVFKTAAEQHLQRLAAQLLFSEAIPQPDVWVPLASRLAVRAVSLIEPQLHLLAPLKSGQGYSLKDEVYRPLEPGLRIKYPDPCDRIKVKKLVDIGSVSDSSVVPGVVCKRNLARKNMSSSIDRSCRVVLISGGIDSSKGLPDSLGGSTLHTLENVSYEHSVLQLAHQVVVRLTELEVELVLVEGLVAGKVTEYMASKRITLVHNVSRTMLERLAPCMGCDVTDKWQLLTSRNVGLCKSFRVDPYGLISLVGQGTTDSTTTPAAPAHHTRSGSGGSSLSGTPGSGQPTSVTLTHLVGVRPLAATILLRGLDLTQAIRIKRVVKFLVQVAYHARLESCFLAAEYTAALAAVGEEVPLTVALGGLDAYRDLVSSAVAQSVQRAASAMPNGLMLAISPHVSMWDASLAAEYDDVLRSLEPPPPAQAPLQLQTVQGVIPQSPKGGPGSTSGRRSAETAAETVALASSLYGAAINGAMHTQTSTTTQGGSGLPRTVSMSPPASPRPSNAATILPPQGQLSGGVAGAAHPATGSPLPGRPPLPPTGTSPPSTAFAHPLYNRTSASGSLLDAFRRNSSGGGAASPPTNSKADQPTISGSNTAEKAPSLASMRSLNAGISDLEEPREGENMGGLSASAIAALAVAAGRGIARASSLIPSATLTSAIDGVVGIDNTDAGSVDNQSDHGAAMAAATFASMPTISTQDETQSGPFTDPLRCPSIELPDYAINRATTSSTPPRTSLDRAGSLSHHHTQSQPSMGSGLDQGGQVQQVQGAGEGGLQNRGRGTDDGGGGQGLTGAGELQQVGGGQEVSARADADHSMAQAHFKAAHGWKVKELMSFTMSTSARGRVEPGVSKPPCEPFAVTLIHQYGDGDLPVKEWLLRNYPRPNGQCSYPGCSEPLERHSRTFVHGGARITLSWVTLDPSVALPGAKDNQVWMWMRPKGKGHIASRDVRRVALPLDAACLSWAAMLQLCMKGENLELGGRCLHYDFVRYLGIGRTVLCIFQDRLRLYTPVLPERCCMYSHKAQLQWLREEASDVLTQGDDAFATIERLLLSAQQANAASMAVEAAAQNGTGAPGSASDPSQASAQQPVEGDSAQSTLSSTLSVVTGAGGSVSVPTPPSGLLSAAFQGVDTQQAALDNQLRSYWLPMLYADRASLKQQVQIILQSAWHMVTLPQDPTITAAPAPQRSEAPAALDSTQRPAPSNKPTISAFAGAAFPPVGDGSPKLLTAGNTGQGLFDTSGSAASGTGPKDGTGNDESQSMARCRTELSFAQPWASGALPDSALPANQDTARDLAGPSFSLQPVPEAQLITATLTRDGPHADAPAGVPGEAAPPAPEAPAPAMLVAGGLFDLVEAQRQMARTKRMLAYTLLTWVSALQDNTAFTAACATSSALMSKRGSAEVPGVSPSLSVSQVGVSIPQQSGQSGSQGASGTAPIPSSPRSIPADMGFASAAAAAVAAAAGGVSAADAPASAPPQLRPMQSGRFTPTIASSDDTLTGLGPADRGAMAVPIVPGAGGPVALAAVADLVVRANTLRGNSAVSGSVGADGTQRLGTSGSLLEGSANMLAFVANQALATGVVPSGGVHVRRPSGPGGETPQPTFSPSREGGVMHHSGSAGGGLRQVGTVTPPRSQSPAASDLGADDDEDRGGPDDVDADYDDDDDEAGPAYHWLGRAGQRLMPPVGQEQDSDDEDSAFYPEALISEYRTDDTTSVSSHPTAHDSVMSVPTHTQLVSAFRPQLPNAAHHQATGSGGGGGSDLTSTHRRVSYATQDVVLGTSPSIANAAVGDGGFKPGSIIGPGAGGEGAGVLQNIPLPSRGGGSGEDGDRVTLKKAPTLRAIQGVARKLGSLVGNNNSAAIGRLYLPCRTILPDTPCDILCPIYDLEYTSIIAYSLSSKFYQQHLNVAFKALMQGLRGQRDVALSSAASWTAAGGGLGPSISHLTLNVNSQTSVGHANALPSPSGEGPSSSMNARTSASFQSLGGAHVPITAAPALTSSSSAGPRGVVPNGMNLTAADWSALLGSSEPYHITHTFEDQALPTPWTRAKFQVVVYYAPQFAELRRQLVQGGEGAFVTSITRCMAWEQRGGKSNAYFAKTRDDRYIIKSMSKTEKSSFLTIAPDYFKHMSRRHLSGQRTCLAKILGVFTVTIKPVAAGGPPGSKDTVMDLLIQENCFYDRPITRIYDLKGSERNRFNPKAPLNPNEWSCEVALDDNLRSEIQRVPYFVAPSAHADLLSALWDDTAFLSKLHIMDYSLLVGVDNQNRLLAMAVIDYIRQYTLDKKMETWVKGSGILGGNGKEPTIISPRDYRIRFRRAILSYFTRVPGTASLRDLPIPDDMTQD